MVKVIRKVRKNIQDKIVELMALERFLTFVENVIQMLGITEKELDSIGFDIITTDQSDEFSDELLAVVASVNEKGKIEAKLVINTKWLFKYTCLPPELLELVFQSTAFHEVAHLHQLLRDGVIFLKEYNKHPEKYEEEVRQITKKALGYYIDDLSRKGFIGKYLEMVTPEKEQCRGESQESSQECFKLYLKLYQESRKQEK